MCTYLRRIEATYYFLRPVPKDLIGHFRTERGGVRYVWKVSLKIKDREEAKRLLPAHVMATDKDIDEARDKRAGATLPPAPPKSEAQLDRERTRWEFELEQEAYESAELNALDEEMEALEPIMKAMGAGVEIDAPMPDVWRAAYLAIAHEKEMARYSMYPAVALELLSSSEKEGAAYLKGKLGKKPKVAAIAEVDSPIQSTSIKALYERYATSGSANPKTVVRWRSRVADLVAFLGHDDVTRVTKANLYRWIAALVAKPVAGKTIRDGYLPAIRAAFNLAHEEVIIPTNPADGLKVRAPKPVQLRDRDLSDDEAATILAATMQPQPAGLASEHKLARRWVPWLCAYTGARVGEITQLRAMDIQEEGGTWFVHITPEAGCVKNGKARKVPLHSHLIEQGFVKLAKTDDKTPLFYRGGAGNEINPAYKVRAADLAKWVRSLNVTAPQPNHGWRHRFKTMTRLHGIPEAVADAIQGHAAASEGRKYGSVPMPVLKEAVEKLPRYLT